MNMVHSWSQEWMDLLGILMNHYLAAQVNTVCKKLAFTRSSPLTASMTV
jgi:hypothetical protein